VDNCPPHASIEGMDITQILIVIGLGVLIALQFRKDKGGAQAYKDAEREQTKKRMGELEAQLQAERSEKDDVKGQARQLKDAYIKVEKEKELSEKVKEELTKKITTFESEQRRKQQDFEKKIEDLEAAKRGYDEERARVIREDEDRLQMELQERDRMWNEHENTVNALLTSLCKMQEHSFAFFDNTNLPEGFDGSLKPDFLIDFLGQYIIFDSKVSKRTDGIQTYISDNVKKTAKKLKNKTSIYPAVFFVVPTDAISELKKTYFYEEGFSFYVISPEALAPILASLKKITEYELTEQLDPLQRENIVGLIADLDWHVNFRNAADIFMSKLGVDILSKARNLDPEIAQEVKSRKENMRMPNMTASDMKSMTSNTDIQAEEIRALENPKASVPQRVIDKAKAVLTEKL
jgi:hypothetical protein